LAGWSAEAAGDPDGPAVSAAGALRRLGAMTAVAPGAETLRLTAADGRCLSVTVGGWTDEKALRAKAGITARQRAGGDPPGDGPAGAVVATYVGLVAAARALHVVSARPRDITVNSPAVAAGLLEGLRPEHAAADVLRAEDGWLVARWRDEQERVLFAALAGATGDGQLLAPVEELATRAWECRLLVAPVRAGPATAPAAAVSLRRRYGGRPAAGLRVVDWSPLWAGPWLTAQLARRGARVVRVEMPQRRDGLLRTPAGRRLWQRWNAGKALRLIDASIPAGRDELAEVVARADVLVTGQTPRVLPQLGLDNAWFARTAPHLLHMALVAYEPPHHDAPGLGEHASAVAGLLWRGDAPPYPPLPWADPLLAAWGLVVVRAWLAAGAVVSGRVQLSLESAAGLAVAREGLPSLLGS